MPLINKRGMFIIIITRVQHKTSYQVNMASIYGGLLGPSYCRTIVLSYRRTVIPSYDYTIKYILMLCENNISIVRQYDSMTVQQYDGPNKPPYLLVFLYMSVTFSCI